MFRFLLPYLMFACISVSFAQEGQRVQVWYEDSSKTLKEVFHVKKTDPSVLEGEYIKYFQNGEVKIKGYYIENEPKGKWDYYYENGNLKMSGERENADEGIWEYFHENGTIKMKGRISGNKKEGRWSYYYDDGKLKSLGNYKEGEKSGDWKYYYEDGNMKALATYEGSKGVYTEFYTNGTRKMHCYIKDDERDSLVTHYYENGQVKSQGMEKGGVKNGDWTYFYKNGNKASEGSYEEGGQSGTWTYFYETGEKSMEGEHENGVKEGEWKVFYIDGTLRGVGDFTNGTGEYKEYYKSGALKISGQMKDGKSHKEWSYYYEDGKLEGKCNFNKGKGEYVGYYKDGTKRREGFIEDGRKVGVWKHYDKNGEYDGSIVHIYPEDQAEVPMEFDVETYEEKETQKKIYPPFIKPPHTRKCKIEWFCPRWPKEYKGRIVSVNPFALLVGELPVSLEFYMQERLGYELTYTQVRNPVFGSVKKLEPGDLFYQGLAVSFKQKFYMLHSQIGMWYFGHELKYRTLVYKGMVADTLVNTGVTKLGAEENSFEYAILLGDRIMGKYNMPGYTFDIFVGLGFGYRHFIQDFENTAASEEVFRYKDQYKIMIGDNKFYVPIRFGFSFGYVF